VILFAYSRGITSNRNIAKCCEKNIVFIALSAYSRPHFTTIAKFISSLGDDAKGLFLEVLMGCDQQELIGKNMFAIDGCKLPSNASKEWRGTKADFAHKVEKMETAIERMIEMHRSEDGKNTDPDVRLKDELYIEKLKNTAEKIHTWMDLHDDKIGCSGKAVKSNITDNDSAKMKTSHGVIQGYVGVAAADQKHHVIVDANAYGQGHENDLLIPTINNIRENFQQIGNTGDVFKGTKLTADSGYHSEKNMKYIIDQNIDAYVADTHFRKRDPRFSSAEKYKEHTDNKVKKKKGKLFKPADFTFAEDLSYCICPAGERLYRIGGNIKLKQYKAVKFKGPKSACVSCQLRAECLQKPEKTDVRQVAFLTGRTANDGQSFTDKMKDKIDSVAGRAIYAQRLTVGEPPFAHIRSVMGLDRFSLRGKEKVNAQWNLFCTVHNLKKVFRYGTLSI
jgi:hypothetical protein